MWKIHGKIYDLTNFLDLHPGGKNILKICEGNEDLTATFESYHAMCDMNKINKLMKKYEIGECEESKVLFKNDGFYKTLQRRVKLLFPNNNYKSNFWWIIKVFPQISLFFLYFIAAFYYHSYNIIYRILFASCAGHMIIQYGFCVMHDASHYAISDNIKVNEFLSDTWNSLAFWDSKLWLKHHVFRHHAFTGNKDLDPDIVHFKPFIRKSEKEDINKYNKYFKLCPKFFSIIITCIFPGMFFSQGIMYNFIWLKKKYLWKMTLPDFYKISYLDLLIKSAIIFSFFYGQSFLVFFSYIVSANTTYFACIMPDHDTFETYKNKIESKEKIDWGELQVRHSANFSTKNPLICIYFGGINYQIEHHLFPTICHIHFSKIQPIVKRTCKEFNIPYVNHNSVLDAVNSTLKTYEYVANKN